MTVTQQLFNRREDETMSSYEIKVHQLTSEPGDTVFSVNYNGCYLDTFGTRADAQAFLAECEAYDAEVYLAAA
jgi:hypothetical protein